MNTNTLVSLLCVATLLAVLGGGVLLVSYDRAEIGAMARRLLGGK